MMTQRNLVNPQCDKLLEIEYQRANVLLKLHFHQPTIVHHISAIYTPY